MRIRHDKHTRDERQSATHFCLVSDQPLANLLPALDRARQAGKVVLAVSPEMVEQAEAQKRVLDGYRRASGITVELLKLTSAYDMPAIRSVIEAWLNAHAEEEVWLNATGGTKPLAMAAQDVFREYDRPVFYLRPETGEVMFLSPGRPSYVVDKRIELRAFIAAHGWSELSRKAPASDPYFNEYPQLVSWLGRKVPQLMGALSTLKRHLHEGGSLPRGDKKLDELVHRLRQMRLLDVDARRRVHSTHQGFITGGWLECYTYQTLRETDASQIHNLTVSLNVIYGERPVNRAPPADAEINELDVAWLAHNRLYALECKTAADSKAYVNFLYKIAFQRRLGGQTTRLGLVGLARMSPALRRRAQRARIELFDVDDLPHLQDHLHSWIQ